MYGNDDPTSVTTPPAPTPATAGGPVYFTDGNAQTGAAATVVQADFLNGIAAELLNVVTSAGLTPSKTNNTQVEAAISSMIASGNTSEAALRAAADTTLGNEITAEIANRISGDTAEAAARVNEDNILAAAIASEATTRANSDTNLNAQIASEATTRSAQDAIASNYYKNSTTFSVNGNGYFILPLASGNIIYQWGTEVTSGGYGLVTYPIPFPSGIFSMVATPEGATTPQNNNVTVGQANLTSCGLFCANSTSGGGSTGSVSCYWMAVGY